MKPKPVCCVIANDQRGFTIIELVAVVAVLVLAVSVLLPVMQKVREGASRESAVRVLHEVCAAAVAFEQRTGAWPKTLDQLMGPAHPLSDGAHAGRHYTLRTATGWEVIADPLPGVTGDESGSVQAPACQPGFTPTPGAASGRAQVRMELAAAAARAVADVVSLLVPTDQHLLIVEARSHVAREDAQRFVFDALDDDDGSISLASIDSSLSCDGSVHPFACDGSVRPIVLRFRLALAQALHLGIYDEDWSALQGILPAVQADPDFFGADTLSILTSAFVHDAQLERELLAAVRRAARAKITGNLDAQASALESLLADLEEGTGSGVSAGGAWTLQTLARIWVGQAEPVR